MPKVFISYRQLSDAQRERVRGFAERLRACGVEVVLDQFYKDEHPGGPPEGWPKWSSDQAEKTEKVLIIGNDSWFRCFDGTETPGNGLGAACEAGIVRQRLYDQAGENESIRVACFDEADAAGISLALKRYHRFHAVNDFADIVAWLGGAVPADSVAAGSKERSWVWHATLESKAAGKVSVLACVETLFAVVLYWWIAIHWHTHWHLMSSVFIAPLLLLRSPESMKLGVDWFLKDWFGFGSYKNWPAPRRRLWLGTVALAGAIVSYCFAQWIVRGGTEISGWEIFGWSILMGLGTVACAMSMMTAVVIAVACSIVVDGVVVGEAAATVAIASLVVGTGVGAVSGNGVATVVGAFLGGCMGVALGLVIELTMGMGIAIACRSLACRIGATLAQLHSGFLRLPGNWKENNFVVDTFIPAELMPGIREKREDLCLDGWLARVRTDEQWWFRWFMGPFCVIIYFLPAFLYRLNIKATCWFWWPLAYLLKPLPKADQAGEQKQALCWPWDNPWQKMLILGPAVVVMGLMVYHYYEPTAWLKLKDAAVPIPLKLILGMEWAHLPPWHWALLVVEACGLGMLWVAGRACGHKANDNWNVYAQRGMKRDLALMHGLARLRSVATVIFLLLGLGMCLISFPLWQKYVPAPVVQGLEAFYHSQDLREQERLQMRSDAGKGS